MISAYITRPFPNTTGPTNSAVGKFGRSGDFDGSDDYISYADTSGSILDITNSVTLSAWIYPRSIPASTSQDRIIDKDSAYNLMISTNDTGCSAGGTGDIVLRAFTSATERICGGTITLNQWSYITGTYDGIYTRIYQNGILQTQYAYTVTITVNDNPLYIGNSSTSARHFDGKIDDVKIYNYARIPSQIIQDMNAGHPLVGTPIAAPVGHWSFDEGYGTTASDNTSNNNDLTLNSASWTNSGKYAKAWGGQGSR